MDIAAHVTDTGLAVLYVLAYLTPTIAFEVRFSINILFTKEEVTAEMESCAQIHTANVSDRARFECR